MSIKSDSVKEHLIKYINAMKSTGKEPSALYVSKQQYEDLRAAAKGGADWKPRFQGYEVRVVE